MRQLYLFLVFLAAACWLGAAPEPARAVTLAPGDVVAFGTPVAGGSRALYKIDPTTGAHSFISATVGAGVTVDPDGNIYVVQPGSGSANGTILRVDAATGAATPIASGLRRPSGIDLDSSGRLVTDDLGGLRFTDPATGSATFVTWGPDASGALMNTNLVAAGPDGSIFTLRFFTESDEETAYAEFVSVATSGAASVLARFRLSDYGIAPLGVAVTPDGEAYYSYLDVLVGTFDVVAVPGFSPSFNVADSDARTGFQLAADAGGDLLLGCSLLPTSAAPSCGTPYSALLIRLQPTPGGFVRSDLELAVAIDALAVVPVPEPATLLLAALGLAMLGARRRGRSA